MARVIWRNKAFAKVAEEVKVIAEAEVKEAPLVRRVADGRGEAHGVCREDDNNDDAAAETGDDAVVGMAVVDVLLGIGGRRWTSEVESVCCGSSASITISLAPPSLLRRCSLKAD